MNFNEIFSCKSLSNILLMVTSTVSDDCETNVRIASRDLHKNACTAFDELVYADLNFNSVRRKWKSKEIRDNVSLDKIIAIEIDAILTSIIITDVVVT